MTIDVKNEKEVIREYFEDFFRNIKNGNMAVLILIDEEGTKRVTYGVSNSIELMRILTAVQASELNK